MMVIKKLIEKNADTIFLGFFIFLFLIEIVVNINMYYYESSLSRLAGYYKLLFELFLIFCLLFNYKKIKWIGLFCLLFLLGQLFSKSFISSISTENITTGNIYYFNRYIYIFIFSAVASLGLLKNKERIISLFKNVMFVNSIFIIIGLIFNLELFKSYPKTLRFGFDGIFVKDGDAAYLYIIFIAYLYSEYLKSKENKKLLLLVGAIIVSFLLGKKIMFLFNTFLFLHFLYSKNLKKWIIPIFISIVGIGFVFHKKILSFFPFLESFYLKNGLVTTIFSTRDLALKSTYTFISDNWGIQNYLFGSIDYIKRRVELEFFDLVFFFGLVGMLLYVFMFYNYFFKNNFKLYNQLIVIIILTSFFSGALLISIPSLLFLYIVLVRKEDYKPINN